MTSLGRGFGWVAAVVVAGLLGMHGAAGGHGATAMTTSATLPMLAMSPGVGVGSATEQMAHPSATGASTGMGAHAMTACVALPVTFMPFAVVFACLTRRRHDVSTPPCLQPVRDARAPPCPPPLVRGVCLT